MANPPMRYSAGMGSAQSEPARVIRDARAERRRIEREFMGWGVRDI
jgi:hypothetical protein